MRKKKIEINNKIIKIFKIIISLVIAGTICFVVAPYFALQQQEIRYSAVRLNTNIPKGTQITSNMVTVDNNVSKNDITSNTVRTIDQIVGTYALQDLYTYDFVNVNEITSNHDDILDDTYLLDENSYIFALSVDSFASAVGTLLEKDDLIRISYYDNETKESVLDERLSYIRVIRVVNEYGEERPKSITTEQLSDYLPAAIYLEVNSKQLELLTTIEYGYEMHASLAYRGTEEQRNMYLDQVNAICEE